MIKKIFYISNLRLPSEKANSYQTIQMCNSFSKVFDKVELWTGKTRNTSEFQGINDIYEYYSVEESFLIRNFWQFDSRILGNVNEFIWANLRDFIFAINICLRLISYRNDPKMIVYTRVWSLLYVFLIFKKIGLVNNRIYYESHKFSKFLLNPLTKLDGVVVINNYLFNLYNKHGLKKLFVAHDGVNIDEYNKISNYQFQPKKKKFNVVYTGSLFLWKGVNTLVDALEYLPVNVQLIFIGGSAQYLANFKKYVKDSGHENRVQIVQHIPKKDLLKYIEIADVLVLPNSAKDKMSLYTSPIKMFEYMASKRPILASDLPSIKEVLTHKKNAILFKSDNEKDLAKKIQSVFSMDCKNLVENAYKEANKYTWDGRARNIKEFIEYSRDY